MAKLITETSFDVELYESKKSDKNMFVVGIYCSADVRNANKRIYKKSLLEREVSKIIKNKVNNKRCFGELGHPPNPEINLDKISIIVESLEWKGSDLYGRSKILDTPMGKITKTLVKEGSLGISSRGLGTVKDDGEVNENFNLLTWDIVDSPSNQSSWINGILESKEFDEHKVPTIEDAQKAYKQHIWQVIENISKSI